MSEMTDVERWIYLEGPEPEPVRSILDAVRDLGPATPEDVERHVRMVALALGGPERREDRGSDVVPPRESDVQVRSGRVEPAERDALPPPPPAPEPAPHVPDSSGRLKVPLTLHSAMMRDPRLAETSKLGDDSVGAAAALVPFLGNTVGRGVVPFPRMELCTYASLRAELKVVADQAGDPDREKLLTDYHVFSEASLRALDEHWAQRLAQDAEERAQYDALLATYTHYVCEERPKGR